MDRKDEIIMNCPICGGKLQIENDMYICQNCGTKQHIDTFFQDTEVFICYVENDFQGRRTRDSVIAQELYNKLSSNNINCFYQRISASDLSELDYQKVYDAAILRSKIVIALSVSKENFIKILENNLEYMKGKIIIPVYSEMSTYDIPKELSSLQCVNYNTVGSMENITKNVLHILKKDTKFDVTKNAGKQRKNKKMILIICTICTLLVGVGIYIVFGTSYVLESRKYNYAEKLADEGRNAAAIEQLLQLKDSENAQQLLSKIYHMYSGYYSTDDEKYIVQFKISDQKHVKLDVVYNGERNGKISFSSENIIEQDEMKYQFVDNFDNVGIYKIKLLDDGFILDIHTEDKKSDSYIKDINYKFIITKKSDAPLQKVINRDKLIEWLKTGVSKDELINEGFELKQLHQLNDGVDEYLYEITNTEIQVAIFTDSYSYDEEINEVSGFLIPARIIIPDKIGKNDGIIFEDNTIYIPNGNIGCGISFGISKNVINEDTIVAVTSKKLIDRAYGSIGKSMEDIVAENHLLYNSDNRSYFRVRKSADDATSQIGAFEDLNNAKKEADAHKAEGYKVYDDIGNLVYEP